MEALSVAETLPETYRHVLDRIADLEASGFRREADLLRWDAIAAYSKRWNDRCAVRLARLAARAERVLDGRDPARITSGHRGARLGRWLSDPRARLRHRLVARIARRRLADPGVRLERPAA